MKAPGGVVGDGALDVGEDQQRNHGRQIAAASDRDRSGRDLGQAAVTVSPVESTMCEQFERSKVSHRRLPMENGYALIRKLRAMPRERGGLTPASR
jgi:hypothetical protein